MAKNLIVEEVQSNLVVAAGMGGGSGV